MKKKLFLILIMQATVFLCCSAISSKSKSPIIQLICKPLAPRQGTILATAFIAKHKGEFYIVTASHAVLPAMLTNMFLKPLNSARLFQVFPKQGCAVDDVCILQPLNGKRDMLKLLRTTQAFELMNAQEFKKFTSVTATASTLNPFVSTPTDIIGCDIRGQAPQVLRVPASFISLNQKHFLNTTNPTTRFKGQVFGGCSGGPILKDNKVCGLVSDCWDIKISGDGDIVPTAVGITESPHLQSIFKALELFKDCNNPTKRRHEKGCASITNNLSFSVRLEDQKQKMSPLRFAREEALQRQQMAKGCTSTNDLLDMVYHVRDVDKALLRKNFAYVFGLEQMQKIIDKTTGFLNSDHRFAAGRIKNGLPAQIPPVKAPNTVFAPASQQTITE